MLKGRIIYSVRVYTHSCTTEVNMKRNIITISREFGSGGRTIGKAVAEKLAIPYYDKELVKQVATETGFHEKYVEQEGEYAHSTSRFAYALSSQSTHGALGGMSVNDFLWVMQRKVILDIAEKGPCVIVGRCADYILRDRDDVLNVFIYADMKSRAERVVRLYGESEKSPEKRLEEKDKKRKVYYKHFTGNDWGVCQNYHLSLDSAVIGIDKCVDMITELVSSCNGKQE